MESNDDSSSFNDIQVDYSVGSNPADISNVGQNDIQTLTVDGTDVTGQINGVSESNNGQTLTVELTGSTTLSQGEEVVLTYGDVQNPGSAGDSSVEVAINTQSTDNPSTATLTIGQTSGGNETPGGNQSSDVRVFDSTTADGERVLNAFETPLPIGSVDNTTNATFSGAGDGTSVVEVANVTFDQAGNVSSIDVDLTGTDGNISTSSVQSVDVTLLNASGDEQASSSAAYSQHNQTVNFDGNVTDVTTIIIDANIASNVPGGQTIDARFTATAGVAEGTYDTLATQQAARNTGFISGNVKDQLGDRVADATVTASRDNSSFEKTIQSADATDAQQSQGDYILEVPPGTYTITANKEGFVGSPALTRSVEDNRTTTANLVIRRQLVPENIEVTPESDSAFVGDNNTFTVTVFDQDGDVLSGTTVDASTENSDIEFVSSATQVTDENGEAEFVVTSDTVVQSANIEFVAQGGDDPSATATKNFIQNGEGEIDGKVYNTVTTDPVENASVYAVLQDQFRQNTEETVVNLGNTTTSDVTTDQVTVTVGADAGGSSLTGVNVDYSAGSGDVSNVGQGDIVSVTVDGNSALDDLNGVSASNNGQTLELSFGGNVDLQQGDEVVVEYSDVQNSADGDSVDVALNPQSANEVTPTTISQQTSSVSTADVAVNTTSDTLFFRLVDNESGQILDSETDYRVQTPNGSATTVRALDDLNTTNESVGEGFVVVDRDGDGTVRFGHTRLAPEDYYAQVSTTAPQNSDVDEFGDASNPAENFTNVSVNGSAVVFQPPADLRLGATEDRANNASTNLVDSPGFVNTFGVDTGGTNEFGGFKLSKLFTNNQVGENYTVIATGAGFNTEYEEVTVTEDGLKFTEGNNIALNLEPQDTEAAQVNITQVGTHPPLAETGGPDTDLITPFDDQSDAFAQSVPRDGGTIDVIEVETLTDNGQRFNGTAIIEIQDDDNAEAGSQSFDGEFVGVLGGTNVSAGEDTITVNTGGDGVATVLLESDSSSGDLLTNKTATLTNDRSATDRSAVRFVGQTNFQSAAISGIVTDTNDDPVQDSVAYVRQFTFPRDNPDTQFRIRPTESGAAGVDEASDTFTIQRLDDTDNDNQFSDENVTATATVTRDELGNYSFPAEDFPGVNVNITGADGYKLVDVVELGTGDDPDASYTLDPVPAVTPDQPGPSTDYTVRAVKIDDPFAGEFRDAGASVQPGFTDDANVVIPIDVSEANFDVTQLSAPANATAGDTITVEADVTNTGGSLRNTQLVEFRLDTDGDDQLESDEALANETVTIEPSDTETVTFNISTDGLAAGNYTHGVVSNDDQSTAVIEIEASGSNGNNGDAGFQEVLDTISAFNNGEASFQEVLDIIEQFNNQSA